MTIQSGFVIIGIIAMLALFVWATMVLNYLLRRGGSRPKQQDTFRPVEYVEPVKPEIRVVREDKR